MTTKGAVSPPASATKSTELGARYSITTDLIYRLDMVTHRTGIKRGLALNALFGDMHVRSEGDKALFDPVNLWNSTMNGQTGGGGNGRSANPPRWISRFEAS